MLKRLFRREKPRVFLGVLAVAPRTGIKRYFDEVGVLADADLDTSLRRNLTEILSLPPADSVSSPKPTDLVLDVVIPAYQSGTAMEVSLGDLDFPILWRPKVTVASRLYSLTTQKPEVVLSITEKMKWTAYLRRLLSPRSMFNLRPMFDRDDMEYLLYRACIRLLTKLQRAI